MRISILAAALIGGLSAAGCSNDHDSAALSGRFAKQANETTRQAAVFALQHRWPSHIASMPDRGDLVRYDWSRTPLRRGAHTVYPVHLSEARALRAIAEGGMDISAPDGRPIRLKYARSVEHADGNWTWIGRPVGSTSSEEAVLTFGDQAVFGSIPDGSSEPLQLTTQGGKTWMVETDPTKLSVPRPAVADSASGSDAIAAPVSTTAPMALASAGTQHPLSASGSHPTVTAAGIRASSAQAAASVATSTVDLVIGYTTGFATRYGGQSQAMTRLNFLVDIANQAYLNSQVHGRLRLVHAVQVDYPDATLNRSALFELSGVQCTNASGPGQQHLPDRDVNCTRIDPPAALQPLLQARERYRADLVSLVRTYQDPENQTCGVAWLLGGGQQPIDAASADFAMSVISDTGGTDFPDGGNTCRNETLAHETGHNLGLAHDQATAAGIDDTNTDGNPLDPEEYGHFAYSFGYKTDASAGNFYTIMAVPGSGQTAYRVFSNPLVTTCGGFPCGVADQADNARTLEQTMPIVAAFRTGRVEMDFNGDGQSDILWRNMSTGANAIWRSGNYATQQPVTTVTNLSWMVMKSGDFDGDGTTDILWRNNRSGANSIWKSGNSANVQAITAVTNLQWKIAGVGDFDGDGRSDILWRNTSTGANTIWLSGNSATPMTVAAVTSLAYNVAGIGDFDHDGFDDILWRNSTTGSNTIWRSGNYNTSQPITAVTNQQWSVAGIGDFNGDGWADVLRHNKSTGANVIWKSANSSTPQAVTTVNSSAWMIVEVGDFNGDGVSDLLWRNGTSGSDAIWLSANFSTQQSVFGVTNTAWKVVP